MPRCGKCGRMNPDQAVFCQDCGARIVEEEARDRAPEAVDSPQVRTCSVCGTVNPSDTAFCRQCGSPLSVDSDPPSAGGRGDKPCPRCGQLTPGGYNFCQHCGYRLIQPEGATGSHPTPPSARPVGVSTPPTLSPPRRVTPPRAASAAMVPPPSSAVRSSSSAASPAAGVPVEPAQPIITAAGYQRESVAAPTPSGLPQSVAGTIGAAVNEQEGALVRLVSVNRDGSDGPAFPVTGDPFDIGRRTATLLFEEDGYLDDRHARIEWRQGAYHLMDLDSRNGVYVRIQDREEIKDGHKILVGMELLRFELIPERERDPAPAVEHGVLVFGTPPKLPWARLKQLTTAGIVRDVYHLYRSEVVMGRESGDIVFSDDDFMSRMHAAIRNEGGKAWVVDLNSSNGTYVQVQGERILRNGMFVRLGDQLLRFEGTDG